MGKRTFIFVIIGWCILTLLEYYFIPFFIVALLWLTISLGLLIITIIELIKLIKARKSLTQFGILKVIVFSILFYLTYQSWIVHGLIEKVDWKIFYNKRMNIVQQVKTGELNPNVSWNNWVCELPFELPVVSNGGNDIGIYRNQKNNSVTVTFWVFRNFFDAPSTKFVYTNDNTEIKELNRQVSNDPKHNWKIQDNWYRTLGE